MKRIIRLIPSFLLVFGLSGLSGYCAAGALFTSTLTTESVQKIMGQSGWVIIDTRLSDAFNGWKLDGVARGGHLSGAVDFSANWLRVDDEGVGEILQQALDTKGIRRPLSVLLYDANGKDAQAVASYLRAQGYEKLYYYNVRPWAEDGELPLETLPNFHRIVPAAIVKAVIDGERPETFGQAKSVKIVEASWGDADKSYSKGHIPTAYHINTDSIEPLRKILPPMWMLASDEELLRIAREYGLTHNDTVIVTAEEPLAAYRVASVLEYLGVADVRILNGGHQAWVMAGYALETQERKPIPVSDFGLSQPLRPDVIDTLDEVKKKIGGSEPFVLVDNRTREEFLGETSGYTYYLKRGRIPGAVYGYAGYEDSYSMDVFRNADNTMRNPEEWLGLWKQQGIDINKSLSFMCGSGWRAAEVYFYADVAGIDRISIFSDGWIGWSNAGLPTIAGE